MKHEMEGVLTGHLLRRSRRGPEKFTLDRFVAFIFMSSVMASGFSWAAASSAVA